MNVAVPILAAALVSVLPSAQAGSAAGGLRYTNFGLDLMTPIFPIDGKIKLYKSKDEAFPSAEFENLPYVSLYSGPLADRCLAKPEDGWVRCNIKGKSGWVRRDSFLSGGQYKPMSPWPIRYWLYVASEGTPGEETTSLLNAARRSPYVVTQKEYSSIFFKVYFDQDGYAISPKTGKRTGDRVFAVGKAVFLAPADDAKRERSTWLFLNYYEPSLQALCPSVSRESCFSAANQAPEWPGIRRLHTSPPPQYAFTREKQEADKTRWEGFEEVAFARFSDPIKPLLYYVPSQVLMASDSDGATEAQRLKNRESPFCIMDCK